MVGAGRILFVGDLETVVTTEIHIVREEEIGNK